jgi:hypothetical protein
MPLATVCFGNTGWGDFKSVLGLSEPSRELSEGRIQVFDSERVILTHFFAYNHVTVEDADSVGALLRDDWKIRIP